MSCIEAAFLLKDAGLNAIRSRRTMSSISTEIPTCSITETDHSGPLCPWLHEWLLHDCL